jgi:hypothetical protein
LEQHSSDFTSKYRREGRGKLHVTRQATTWTAASQHVHCMVLSRTRTWDSASRTLPRNIGAGKGRWTHSTSKCFNARLLGCDCLSSVIRETTAEASLAPPPADNRWCVPQCTLQHRTFGTGGENDIQAVALRLLASAHSDAVGQTAAQNNIHHPIETVHEGILFKYVRTLFRLCRGLKHSDVYGRQPTTR